MIRGDPMLFDCEPICGFWGTRISLWLLLATVLISAAGRAQEVERDGGAELTTDELRAAAWLAHLRACQRDVRSLRARFTQEIHRKMLGKKEVMKGTVEARRGRRVRLEYQSPQSKLLVSDGVKLVAYDPGEQRLVSTPIKRSLIPQVFELLLGSGDIQSFAARHLGGAEHPGSGPAAIELIPLEGDAIVQSFVVTVTDSKPCASRVLVVDQAGAIVRIEIQDVEINVTLENHRFVFKPPPGVDVIKP